MIEVIYIATDSYVKYFDVFAETIQYFWPGMPKIVRIWSDAETDFVIECDDVIRVENVKIFNLFYPCINLNKTNFIQQLSNSGAEYVFYFDADTRFFKVDNVVWDNLKEYLDNDYFCIGRQPFYQISDDVYWKKEDIGALYSKFTERDETQETYISRYEYTYVISSFFCANKGTMARICARVEEMIQNDLTQENRYRIPLFFDENYFNKLVFNYEYMNDNTFKLKVGDYMLYGGVCESIPNPNESFMFQKGDNRNKRLKR